MIFKLKIPLKYKFLGVLMFTLTLGFATFFILAYRTFSEDKKLFVMELNLSILRTAVSDTRADLKSRVDELQTLLPKIYETNTTGNMALLKELSLQHLPDELLGARFYRRNLTDSSFTLIKEFKNSELLDSKSLPQSLLTEIENQHHAPLADFSFANGTNLLNRSISLPSTSGPNNVSVLTLLIPGNFVNDNTKSVIIVVDLVQDFLRKKLGQSELSEVFLITKSGKLLSHSSSEILTANSDKVFEHPIIERLTTHQLPRESLELKVKNEPYLCNLMEAGLPEIYAVSQIKRSQAFQALQILLKETLLTGIFILSIALILSIVFAARLTSNIKKLRIAAEEIGKGSLNPNLDIQSNDEIESVAQSFTWMASEIQKLLIETEEKARMAKELEDSKVIQSTLLSASHFTSEAAEIEPFYLSASECGGDVWDAYLSGNILTVLLGDATGHGAPAAIVTAVAKSCFITLNSINSQSPLSPEQFLKQLNQVVYESCKGQLFMTMAVIQINLSSGEMTFSNAGHESPLILKANKSGSDKRECESLFVRGERLGFSMDSQFEKITTQIDLGDTLLIYTDGVSEAVNPDGKQFGERALKKILKQSDGSSLTEIKDKIYSDVTKFMGGTPQLDDITYVLVKWNKKMEKLFVEPIQAESTQGTMEKLAKKTEFTEEEIDTHYARLETQDEPNGDSTEGEAA